MKRWLAPVLILCNVVAVGMVPLAAIAQTPKTIKQVTYRCDDGKGFTAVYRDDDTVKATFGSKVLELQQEPEKPAVTEVRYTNGGVTLQTKGNTAFVEVGDNTLFENCVETGRVSGLW